MSLQNTQGFWPVTLAIGGNVVVAIIKFFAAFSSGSTAMFSEAIHSVADTLNQILLLIGLRQSLRKRDVRHDYGYGNERFFWALISACGVFFIGAGVTAYRGIDSFINPKPIEFGVNIILVLAASFIIEFYTLRIASRQLAKTFPDLSWSERMMRADSSTLAVVLEDFIAVVGIVIAGASIAASYYSGNPAWDAIGSIIIAGLLATVAIILILKNRSYLIGRSLPDELRESVIEFMEKDPAIERVLDFKSNAVGLGVYRIKCEVEFNGAALLRAAYRETTMQEQYEEIKNDMEGFKRFLAEFADRIPRLMGKKIDEIEAKIRKRYPNIRHIDIEVN